jgi:D-lyxose ketol-isomerase
MITKTEANRARKRATTMLERAGIAITSAERANIEVADLGLGELNSTGLEIIVYENNTRYCAKELILFPGQTCPQHRHPGSHGKPGKQETFRCRWGIVYLYIPGRKTARPHGRPPKGREKYYTVWKEIILRPGEQHTIPPNTMHWFQPGPHGAIVSEFSSPSNDGTDIFQDPNINRITKVK